MGFGLIAAGILFLFNPNINVFDFLPDFVGYILIFCGLFRMSFASPRLQDVRGMLWKLILITGVHFFSFLLLPFADGDSYYLVIVFVFAILETMYLIPAIIALFDGFYELGRRFDTNSVYYTYTRHIKHGKGAGTTVKIEGSERLKTFTIAFFLLKNVAYVLPELTALQLSDDFSSNSRLHVALSDFKPLFYGVCFLIVSVFGILWTVRFWKYVMNMRRDIALTKQIQNYYTETVGNNPALLAALDMKKVRTLFILASITGLMFIMEGVDIIPNALSSVILIAAFLILAKFDKLAYGGIVVSVITAALSVVNLFIQIPYYEEYDAEAARYIAGAAERYGTVQVAGVAEYIAVLVMFGFAFTVFCRVIRQHAGYIGITGNVPQYSAEARRKELLNSAYAGIFGASIAGILYYVLCAAYFTLSMYLAEVFLINGIVYIFWIAAMIRAMNASYENIYERLEMNY